MFEFGNQVHVPSFSSLSVNEDFFFHAANFVISR